MQIEKGEGELYKRIQKDDASITVKSIRERDNSLPNYEVGDKRVIFVEDVLFPILDEVKQDFYDVLHDFPFPTEARNNKIVELIKKWFGE